MSLLTGVEFALWVTLAALFRRKGLQRRFPAMGAYLALRVASAPVLWLLLTGDHLIFPSQTWLITYFYFYWAVYGVSALLLYFVCLEVFRTALSAYAGLLKLGTVAFRWVVLASVIVTLSSTSFKRPGILMLPDIADGLMRSVSILELCLLAFLCMSMNALRFSIRDMAFGIALGLGLMSANDFAFSSLVARNSSLTTPLQFVYQSLIMITASIWIAYCALPEPVHEPVVVPVDSTLYRWNKIASALGHTGTRVAVQQPVNSFFLTDVEKVVEKVLDRSFKDRKSES